MYGLCNCVELKHMVSLFINNDWYKVSKNSICSLLLRIKERDYYFESYNSHNVIYSNPKLIIDFENIKITNTNIYRVVFQKVDFGLKWRKFKL